MRGLTASLRGRSLYAIVALGVVILDHVTKWLAEARLDPYRSVVVIPGFFDLTLVRNPGGVFGLFRDLDPSVRSALFTLVPMLAVVLILVYAYKTPASHRLAQTALALILGGALGNLSDRLRFGHVIDFLDVYVGEYHWPAFNLADSAICVGVGLLVVESLFAQEREPSEEPEKLEAPDMERESS